MKTPEEIIEQLYRAFGTDTGILFGISPELRSSVEAIVGIVYYEIIENTQKED